MSRWRFNPLGYLGGNWQRTAAIAIATIVFVCGLAWQHAGLIGLGAALLCLPLCRVGGDATAPPSAVAEPMQRHAAGAADCDARSRQDEVDAEGTEPAVRRVSHVLEEPSATANGKSTESLIEELLSTGRYALLLRPETKQHLNEAQILRAIRHLDEAMALVPAGRVLIGQLAEQASSACGSADVDPRLSQRNLIDVQPVYLDRYCVTNEQYQQFVDAGGYEQLEFWHEEALPALLDFVDQTGAPGPRFWNDGQYEVGQGRLPVVGISWYEACAYGQWVGKRLPTDAEWTKAGSWPVEASPGRIAQRRFPWGESFDSRRAHLYGSGLLAPVAVDEYPGGISVGGVHQLIGNVWEWTTTPLAELGDPTLHVSESVMSVRGGAFDTYFENQATCHYQSGEHRLSRRANIGFRLALAMCDLEQAVQKNADDDVHMPAPVEPMNEPATATC